MRVLSTVTSSPQEIITTACEVLRSGGLVIYPTETTYGIGADVKNSKAIEKLLDYKGKRDGKPLSVAVASMEIAEEYVVLNETAKKVYATFLPGPVTVISSSRGTVAKGVASQDGSLGIRIPKYQLILDLLSQYGRGITATGANASYKKRPYTVSDIFDCISEKQKKLIDLVIDAGRLPKNEPSTVIDTTIDDIQVLRVGTAQFVASEERSTTSVEETQEVAIQLIQQYRSYLTYTPVIIALTGKMGAGKTHFVQGIAKALSIQDPVTSPTYTLANEYTFTHEDNAGMLVHVDAWRMTLGQDLCSIGFAQMLNKNACIAIEWAERFKSEIEKEIGCAKIIWVSIDRDLSLEDARTITIAHL